LLFICYKSGYSCQYRGRFAILESPMVRLGQLHTARRSRTSAGKEAARPKRAAQVSKARPRTSCYQHRRRARRAAVAGLANELAAPAVSPGVAVLVAGQRCRGTGPAGAPARPAIFSASLSWRTRRSPRASTNPFPCQSTPYRRCADSRRLRPPAPVPTPGRYRDARRLHPEKVRF
jgi:hypothetical protein